MLKIGMNVRGIGYSSGLEGIITKIQQGFDTENHGTIEIRVSKISNKKRWSWLKIGDLEHFVEFEWEKDLEIIE